MQQIYLSSYQYAYYSFETNWKILLKTSEKGIILEPTPKLKVDCYVNAALQDYGIEKITMMKIASKAEQVTSCALANGLYFGSLDSKMV